jgi:hypothetical protein
MYSATTQLSTRAAQYCSIRVVLEFHYHASEVIEHPPTNYGYINTKPNYTAPKCI